MRKNFTVLVVVFIVLIIAIFLGYSKDQEAATFALSISTFLLAIVLGFSISDRHSRLDKIRDTDSDERGNLVEIVLFLKSINKKIYESLRKALENYFIAGLDFQIWDFEKTEKEFSIIREEIFKISKMKKTPPEYGNILDMFNIASGARDRSISLIDDRLSRLEWAAFLFLSAVIIVSLIILQTGTLISIIIVATITTSILALLYFLHRLDALTWKYNEIILEPYQRGFEAIGCLRYYPRSLVRYADQEKLKRKTYRIADYPAEEYPSIKGKKITIVKPSMKNRKPQILKSKFFTK